ncbi:hypothetical protein [Streptomyces naphthomycinicus]|uniref:hypothetical protein n=1 Tax=Streptomyces naphthomycinicus TaxID=2872625 RepID=UPI001CEC678C|nr:hypothetical protein [Streptomyces sp. TML10]
MAVGQLPGRVREFASYLDALLARLDPRGGWSGVFWQRDPEGMRACLDGREVPPWDVVESLLEDLGAAYGPAAATAERERARALHTAALTAYDARSGARDVLLGRLDGMLREQRYAAERHAELSRLLSAPRTAEEAESLRSDLAWARDDHARATARCAELRARLAESDRRRPTGPPPRAATPAPPARPAAPPATGLAHPAGPSVTAAGLAHPAGPPATAAAAGSAHPAGLSATATGSAHPAGAPTSGPGDPTSVPGAPAPAAPIAGAPPSGAPLSPGGAALPGAPAPARGENASSGAPARPRKRRRGGARFAGGADEDGVAPVVTPVAVPEAASAGPEAGGGRRTPRGARFAGAGEVVEAVAPVVDEEAGAAVGEAVARLARLRAEGRSGEAHVLLVEAARWPVGRLPLLADALHRAGLGADWATLLWEAAALPAERLVAAADALAAAGRDDDGRQMLRQGVARPAEQLGAAVLRLADEGRDRELRALLDACVRGRTPEEAARCAAVEPGRLVPLLLGAALGVSDERHWDLVHALRVAGYAP